MGDIYKRTKPVMSVAMGKDMFGSFREHGFDVDAEKSAIKVDLPGAKGSPSVTGPSPAISATTVAIAPTAAASMVPVIAVVVAVGDRVANEARRHRRDGHPLRRHRLHRTPVGIVGRGATPCQTGDSKHSSQTQQSLFHVFLTPLPSRLFIPFMGLLPSRQPCRRGPIIQ